MKATDFEYKHQLLLHQLVVVAAFSTYLIDRDDVVWRFIKNGAGDVRLVERSIFGVVTLLFGISAYLSTASRACLLSRPDSLGEPKADRLHHTLSGYLGELLYAFALGCLAPLSGFLILVGCEAIRIFRLARRDNERWLQRSSMRRGSKGARAFQIEAIKWGIFLTMIVFTFTLRDRIAEVLIAASVVVWMLLNLPFFYTQRLN